MIIHCQSRLRRHGSRALDSLINLHWPWISNAKLLNRLEAQPNGAKPREQEHYSTTTHGANFGPGPEALLCRHKHITPSQLLHLLQPASLAQLDRDNDTAILHGEQIWSLYQTVGGSTVLADCCY